MDRAHDPTLYINVVKTNQRKRAERGSEDEEMECEEQADEADVWQDGVDWTRIHHSTWRELFAPTGDSSAPSGKRQSFFLIGSRSCRDRAPVRVMRDDWMVPDMGYVWKRHAAFQGPHFAAHIEHRDSCTCG